MPHFCVPLYYKVHAKWCTANPGAQINGYSICVRLFVCTGKWGRIRMLHRSKRLLSPIIWSNKSSTQHLICSGPFSIFVWNVSPLDSGLSALEDNQLGRIRCWVWTRDRNPGESDFKEPGTGFLYINTYSVVANQWSRVKHCEDEVSENNPKDYSMD